MDVQRTEAERNALVVSNIGLAKHFAKRYQLCGESFDDLLQVACIAMMKAATSWNPDGGMQYASWASLFIRGEYQRLVRRRRKLQRYCLTLDEPMFDDGEGTSRKENVPGDEDTAALANYTSDQRLVKDAVASLPARNRDILLRTMAGETYDDVGRDYNLSRERVRQIRETCLRLVRLRAGVPATSADHDDARTPVQDAVRLAPAGAMDERRLGSGARRQLGG